MKINQIKKCAVIFFKLSIAILVFWYLFKTGYLLQESFVRLFKINNLPSILLSGLAFLVSLVLATIRLILLLKAINLHIQFAQCFKLTMVGSFFNIVLPGTISGDVVKGFYLTKHEEHSKGRSSGIIVVDRTLGLLAMIFIGCLSIAYLLLVDKNLLNYRYELSIILSVLISSVCVFGGVLLLCSRNQHIRNIFKAYFTRIFRRGIVYYMVDGIRTLAKNRRVFIYSMLLSLLIQMSALAGLINLANIVPGIPSDFITFIAISSLVILLGVVPITPGNIGWTELLAAYGWSVVGSNAGAEIFLYWRIISALCSLPGGGLYFLMSQHYKRIEKVNEISVVQTGGVTQETKIITP